MRKSTDQYPLHQTSTRNPEKKELGSSVTEFSFRLLGESKKRKARVTQNYLILKDVPKASPTQPTKLSSSSSSPPLSSQQQQLLQTFHIAIQDNKQEKHSEKIYIPLPLLWIDLYVFFKNLKNVL